MSHEKTTTRIIVINYTYQNPFLLYHKNDICLTHDLSQVNNTKRKVIYIYLFLASNVLSIKPPKMYGLTIKIQMCLGMRDITMDHTIE